MCAAPPGTSIHERVRATWARAFPELTDPVHRPGTSLLADATLPPTGWVSLWPVGRRVVGRAAPQVIVRLEAVLSERPAGHRLTADDAALAWPRQRVETSRQRLYALDPSRFRPARPRPGQQVRRLGGDDRTAFAAFSDRCPSDDLDEGDVGIGGDHEVTVGVWAADRLVAVASMFAWRGFSDLGVVTDPAHRGQGAGSAAVSALCQHLATGPRVVVYRHVLDNHGSAGIARTLALTPIGVAESVRPVPSPG